MTLGTWRVLPEEADKDYIRVRGTRLGAKYKIANVPVASEYDLDAARWIAKRIAAVPEMYELIRALAGDTLHESPFFADRCECYHCNRIRAAGEIVKAVER
jgi:hypothetical protein